MKYWVLGNAINVMAMNYVQILFKNPFWATLLLGFSAGCVVCGEVIMLLEGRE